MMRVFAIALLVRRRFQIRHRPPRVVSHSGLTSYDPGLGVDVEWKPGMSGNLERRFHNEMLEIYREAAKLGYRPSYFLQMVGERGGSIATTCRR